MEYQCRKDKADGHIYSYLWGMVGAQVCVHPAAIVGSLVGSLERWAGLSVPRDIAQSRPPPKIHTSSARERCAPLARGIWRRVLCDPYSSMHPNELSTEMHASARPRICRYRRKVNTQYRSQTRLRCVGGRTFEYRSGNYRLKPLAPTGSIWPSQVVSGTSKLCESFSED